MGSLNQNYFKTCSWVLGVVSQPSKLDHNVLIYGFVPTKEILRRMAVIHDNAKSDSLVGALIALN